VPLVLVGVATEWRRVGSLLSIALLFTMAYSYLPHKELRFVFYVIPLLNIIAAIGADRMYVDVREPATACVCARSFE